MNDCKDGGTEAEELWRDHVETGEPLDEREMRVVVAAGLAEESDWEERGGGLFWHGPTWPDPDAAK